LEVTFTTVPHPKDVLKVELAIRSTHGCPASRTSVNPDGVFVQIRAVGGL
jgi:hypothetical protein